MPNLVPQAGQNCAASPTLAPQLPQFVRPGGACPSGLPPALLMAQRMRIASSPRNGTNSSRSNNGLFAVSRSRLADTARKGTRVPRPKRSTPTPKIGTIAEAATDARYSTTWTETKCQYSVRLLRPAKSAYRENAKRQLKSINSTSRILFDGLCPSFIGAVMATARKMVSTTTLPGSFHQTDDL